MARGRRGSGIPVDPELVRKARLDAGLTLGGIAGSEISRTFIHQIEHGRSRPSMEVLRLIARRTDKPMDYFLPGASGSRVTIAELSAELTKALDTVTHIIESRQVKAGGQQSMQQATGSLRRAIALSAALEASTTD